MGQKILWGTVLFVVGFFWFYLGGRQLLFNFITAHPLVNKFSKQGILDKKMATRFTITSTVMWIILCGLVAFVIFYFGGVNLKIGFVVGVALGLVLNWNRMGPSVRSNVDAFVNTYYRFMPDDVLRTNVYNNGLQGMADTLGSDLSAYGIQMNKLK